MYLFYYQDKLDVHGVLERLRRSDQSVLRGLAAASPALKRILTEEALGDPHASHLIELDAEARTLQNRTAAHAFRVMAHCLKRRQLDDSTRGDEADAEGKDLFREDNSKDRLTSSASLRRASSELWRVYGWLARVTTTVRTAVDANDGAVLGGLVHGNAASHADRTPPELLVEVMGRSWGWGLMAWDVLGFTSAVTVYAISKPLAAVAGQVIGLLRTLLLRSRSPAALCLLDVLPCPSPFATPLHGSDSEAPSSFEDASGLAAFITRLGTSPAVFESSRPCKLWPLVAQLLRAFADGLKTANSSYSQASRHAERRVVGRLIEAGLGLRFGDALNSHGILVRTCIAQRCEGVHLSLCYLELRGGLQRMWTAILRNGSEVRLVEQVLLGNVIEGLVSDWCSDELTVDTSGSGSVSRAFTALDGHMLLRDQGLDLLAALVHRRKNNAALATELMRQARRHNFAGAERERLCRWGASDSILAAGVVKALTLLAGLESPAVDRCLEADANVPPETLALLRLASVAPQRALQDAWREWVRGECTSGRDAGSMADTAEAQVASGTASLGPAIADAGLLLALSGPALLPQPAAGEARQSMHEQALTAQVEPPSDLDGSASLNESPQKSSKFVPDHARKREGVEEGSTPQVLTLTFRGALGQFSVQTLLATLAGEVAGSDATGHVTVLALRGSPITVDLSIPGRLAEVMWGRAERGILANSLNEALSSSRALIALTSITLQARGTLDASGAPLDRSMMQSADAEDPPSPPRVRWRASPQEESSDLGEEHMGGAIVAIKKAFDLRARGATHISFEGALAAMLDLGIEDGIAVSSLQAGPVDQLSLADLVRAYLRALQGTGDVTSSAPKAEDTTNEAASPRPEWFRQGEEESSEQVPPQHQRRSKIPQNTLSTNREKVPSTGETSEEETLLWHEFERLDMVGEGRLTMLTLKAAYDTSSEDDLRAWLRERDRDHKGFVDFDDVVAFHRTTGQGLAAPRISSERILQRSQGPHAISEPINVFEEQAKREVAIRQAFDAYDLNGDGLITYLELRTVLARNNRRVSEAELREWIRVRDRSNNGGVSFMDFRAAYLAQR